MKNSRDVYGLAAGSLAATIAAMVAIVVRIPLSPYTGGWELLAVALIFYVIAFLVGMPACLAIRLLPTRSLAIYVLWGMVVGAIVAPVFQYIVEYWAHGHKPPDVSGLVWLGIRMAIAGGIGFGVFWLVAARPPDRTVESDARNNGARPLP